MLKNPEWWAREIIELNVPFKEKGRDRSGLDCWGVVHLGLRECFGVEVPSYVNEYKTIKDQKHLAELIGTYLPEWKPVDIRHVKAGDVALLEMDGRPIHVGLVYKRGWMVHIEANINVCSERYNSKAWGNGRLIGIYRHPALA